MVKLHFLITAGGTREYIDPVRFISNASSGKMGYALADTALKVGHKVTLITTARNSKLKTQNSKLKIVEVVSADEMFGAVKKHFKKCDCLIMAAAVSDYKPFKKSKIKIKKTDKDLVIRLRPTVDILKWAGKNKEKVKGKREKQSRDSNGAGCFSKKVKRKIVIGFALEDKNLRKNAEKKLIDKNLDMIIANSLAAVGAESVAVQIKTVDGRWVKMPAADKTEIAAGIIRLAENLY